MEKKNDEKLEDILSNISDEFPKISLKNVVNLEDYINNIELDEKVIKELSFFLLDYDKKSIDNNSKYGFPENDFEDYKDRDLFICRSYKAIISKLEENDENKDTIKAYVRKGAQKVQDRKIPYRCLELGRLDFKESYPEFKEYSTFFSERIKKYDKGYSFEESDNTKAYNSSKKTNAENMIKLFVVIAIVMVIFFIGRFVGQWATKKFTEEKPTNQTEENRTIEII